MIKNLLRRMAPTDRRSSEESANKEGMNEAGSGAFEVEDSGSDKLEANGAADGEMDPSEPLQAERLLLHPIDGLEDSSEAIDEWNPLFETAQPVEALRDGEWCVGMVACINTDRTYDIIYTDKPNEYVSEGCLRALDVEEEQPKSAASLLKAEDSAQASVQEDEWVQITPIEEGTLVEVRKEGHMGHGVVRRLRMDGSFDVDFDNGEREAKVQPGDVRVRVEASGATVVCNCHGLGVWFRGVILQERVNGTFDVKYDDGECEYGVHAPFMRVLCRPLTKIVLKETGLVLGMMVVGNYHQKGTWYEGIISRVNGDNTYAIDYEDGGRESAVSWEHLRRIGSPAEDDVDDGASTASTEALADEKVLSEKSGRSDNEYKDTASTEALADGKVLSEKSGRSDKEYKDEDIDGASKEFMEVNAKVSANFKGKGAWLSGAITKAHHDGTFDIKYDTGEREWDVKAALIRAMGTVYYAKSSYSVGDLVAERYHHHWLLGVVQAANKHGTYQVMPVAADDQAAPKSHRKVAGKSLRLPTDEEKAAMTQERPRPSASAVIPHKHELIEGTPVEVILEEDGVWHPATIRRDLEDDSDLFDCDVMFSSSQTKRITVHRGSIRLRVRFELIDSPPRSLHKRQHHVAENTKVKANYRGRGKFYAGVVKRDNKDGTFDILYDDGQVEAGVDRENIEICGDSPRALTSPYRPSVPSVGNRVEGNFKGKGKWFPGVVVKVDAAGLADIDYDDGDRETGVPVKRVRVGRAQPEHEAAFKVGVKVEANYRGRGQWYAGVIVKDHGSGTYDVDYNDGEKEYHLTEGMIKLYGEKGKERAASDVATRSTADVVSSLFRADDFGDIITALRAELRASMPDEVQAARKVKQTFKSMDKNSKGFIRGQEFWSAMTVLGADISTADVQHVFAHMQLDTQKRGLTCAQVLELLALDHIKDDFEFEAGMRVEANYRSKGRWYPGVLEKKNDDETFSVHFDDGEDELRVSESLLRSPVETERAVLKTQAAASPAAAPAGGGLFVGARVKANFRNKGKWYNGRIVSVNRDFTYNIDFDDGDSEQNVIDDLIITLASEGTRKPFAMGDKVEANYRAKDRWLQGVIAGGNADGTYEIKYDDGEVEKNVRGLSMRLIDVANAVDGGMKAGARVEANFRNRGSWLPGCVKKVNRDGTWNVDYDYGEMEARVKADCIRVTPTQKATPITPNGEAADAKTLATLVVGSEVEANYGGEGRWLPGRVVRIRPSGTYDIHFDTGDYESFVVPEDVRKASPAEAVITPSKPITRPLAQSKSDSKAVKGGRTYRVAGQSPSPIQIKDSEGSDDSDLELGVVSCKNRKTSPKARAASKKQETTAFVVGAAVEGNYRKKGFWFPGKIKRDRGNGYDITYDDGEFETRVAAEFVRAAREVEECGGRMASRRFSGSRVITASRGGEEEEVQGQGQGQGLMSPKGNGKKYKTGTLQANQRPGESKSSKDSNGSMVISKSELTVLKQLLSSKEQQIQQALKSAAGSSVKSQGSMVISKAELTVLKQLLATKDQEIQTLKTVDQSQGRNGSMNISKAELTVLKQLLATKDQEIQALKTEAGSVQSKGSDGSMNISKAELALLKNLLATKEQQIQALKTAADVPPPSSQSKNRSARKEAEDGTSVAANARALRAATADLLAAGKEQQIQALKAAAESVQSQGDASIDVSKAELTVLKQLLAAKEQQIQQALITAAEVGPPSPKSKGSRPPKGGSPRNDPIENTPSPTSASKAIKVANAKMAEQLAAMQQQLRDVAAALDVSKASQSRLAKQEKALEMQIRKLNAN